MNAGAKMTRAALLCFHHADSELRPEHLASLVDAARTTGNSGGAFHRRFDDRRVWMTWWERLLRRISKVAGPLFGDQSLFVKSRCFSPIGWVRGYPDHGRYRLLQASSSAWSPSHYSIRRFGRRQGGFGAWATRAPYLSIQRSDRSFLSGCESAKAPSMVLRATV